MLAERHTLLPKEVFADLEPALFRHAGPEVLQAHLQTLKEVDEIGRSLCAARAEQRPREPARCLLHHQQRCQLLLLLSLLHLRMHI